MANKGAEVEQNIESRPLTFCYRFPTPNSIELCIGVSKEGWRQIMEASHLGRAVVFPVTISQAKCGMYQLAGAINKWKEPDAA